MRLSAFYDIKISINKQNPNKFGLRLNFSCKHRTEVLRMDLFYQSRYYLGEF